MNKIYKVVWNATRGCYVVASELVKTHQGKKSTRRGGSILSRAGTALLLAIAGWGAACNFISLLSQAGARLAISSMRT